jgi:PIN domain nuclease of toxin-antitoxin system
MIVLDTSALLYWTLDPGQLSDKADQRIAQADRILVGSISIWEIGLKVKRGKLIIPLLMTDFVERLERLEQLEILPVDVRTWLDNLDLDWEQRDPADRTIVALAKRFNCELIASDVSLREYYSKTIW